MSTNQTITSHNKSLNIYNFGSPGPGMRQAQKYGSVNPIDRHCVLDNCIANVKTDINKRWEKNPA